MAALPWPLLPDLTASTHLANPASIAPGKTIGNTGKFGDLWRRLWFLLGAIIVYRIGAHIPVPGIDPVALSQLFENQKGGILGVFNLFSGGALSRFTIFALGIMPYISASIIMQLVTIASPQLEALKKEGEAGRRKITQYTRYGTVFLALFQGVGIAVALSLAFGALLTFGPRSLTFEAQETIGGVLSIIAVGFVTWMIFWMAKHARGLSGELHGQIDKAAGAAWFGLVLVAFLAVAREGLETALFLWAATQTAADGGSATGPILGAAIGQAVAVIMGWAFYKAALRINLSRFFAWTGGFLIIVAAGVLAYGFHDLQEAGILPGLNNLAFDVSHIIEPGSFIGTVLKGIFNFSPQTTWVEAVAWLSYVAIVMPLFIWRIRSGKPKDTSTPTVEATPTPAKS